MSKAKNMTTHCINVYVTAPKKFSPLRICGLVDRLISIGFEEAQESEDEGFEDPDLEVVNAVIVGKSFVE